METCFLYETRVAGEYFVGSRRSSCIVVDCDVGWWMFADFGFLDFCC